MASFTNSKRNIKIRFKSSYNLPVALIACISCNTSIPLHNYSPFYRGQRDTKQLSRFQSLSSSQELQRLKSKVFNWQAIWTLNYVAAYKLQIAWKRWQAVNGRTKWYRSLGFWPQRFYGYAVDSQWKSHCGFLAGWGLTARGELEASPNTWAGLKWTLEVIPSSWVRRNENEGLRNKIKTAAWELECGSGWNLEAAEIRPAT